MPFDGSGNFTPSAAPNFPSISGTVINPTYYNTVINDLASGLSNCLTRDGQGKPSAAIDWNAKNLTNVAALGAVSLALTGSATIATTLGVTGATTLFSTLAVTGAVTLANNLTVAGTLAVTGAVALTVPLSRASGGTGVATATTDGQLLIGNTSTGNFNLATLTAGANVIITNAGGSITIAAVNTGFPAAGVAVSTGAAWAASLASPAGGLVGLTATQTLTAKRITKRVVINPAAGSSAQPTSDTADQYNIIGISGGFTIDNPSGTPTDGQELVIVFKDDGVSRGLAFGGAYIPFGVALLPTTVAGKHTYMTCRWNAANSVWHVISQATET